MFHVFRSFGDGFSLFIFLKFFPFTDRVNHKPIITSQMQNETLKIGASFKWNCTVISDLHKHVQWVFGAKCKNCSDLTDVKVMVHHEIYVCF